MAARVNAANLPIVDHHGAPEVGLSGVTYGYTGASPPGCFQSEHAVQSPAHFQYYSELVQQSGEEGMIMLIT